MDVERRAHAATRQKRQNQPRTTERSGDSALRQLREQHSQSDFVCGGLRSPRAWFESAVEAAKIEDFIWHCLRHTFASRLVMSGAGLRTVAELLRDKTLAMVIRYVHLTPDNKLDAVERMAKAFRQAKSDTKLAPPVETEMPATAVLQ